MKLKKYLLQYCKYNRKIRVTDKIMSPKVIFVGEDDSSPISKEEENASRKNS